MGSSPVRVVLAIEPFALSSAVQACLSPIPLIEVHTEDHADGEPLLSLDPARVTIRIQFSEHSMRFELTVPGLQQIVHYSTLQGLTDYLTGFASGCAAVNLPAFR